jgi:hypothetical protein
MASVVSFTAEWVALELNFWTYNEKAVIPVLEIGLSPFLSIIINPALSFFLAFKTIKYGKKPN